MAICFKYAFCTARGEITENVFVSPNDAEMWATRLSEDNPGTLYIYDEDCWVPDMVFGLPDDDLSVVARGMAFVSAVKGRGMAFVSAVKGGDYAGALRDYIGCEELPEAVKETLLSEISDE